ncbi:MAG: efflux RND transporter periplasmic adaptor subunit [Acidobacteriota bacterium]
MHHEDQNRRHPSWPLLPALLAAAGLLALGGCADDAPPTDPEPRTVRTTVVGGAETVRSRTFSGTSQSGQQSRLSFKVGGTISDLPIEVGDRLRRGQLVARLDAFQYELEVERADADLVRARAAERNAEATYERTKELYADNNASRGDLDAARANAESAAAQTRAAEKLLELSRLQVSYTQLRAATDCSVANIDVEVNENVSSGSPVATVDCGTTLEVTASIPESLIGEMTEGMAASIRFDSLPDAAFSGVLTEIGSAPQGGAAFPITVSVDGDHPELRAGLAAELSFDFQRRVDAVVLVPLSAVVRGQGGTFVFLAESTGAGDAARAVRRDVSLGELTEGGLEVTAGLAPGDRVITAGVSKLYDGLDVRLDPAAVTPPTADASGSPT